ncbi:cupin domain-containing protein [Caballeronia glebae]|uniref:cupin domain-containing protein n=1 Tax=Caballeronia glebae TaxID=1777143 RepID=UPI0038BD254E
MSTKALAYSQASPEVIEKFSPPDTLVKGNPKQKVHSFYAANNANFRAGVWEGEVGAYRLEFPEGKHEFFVLKTGEVKVHSDDGSVVTISEGEACVLPGGFKGVFEITKYAAKHFVVLEQS